MSRWSKIVETQNAKTYTWPADWDTREEVARQLGCSEENVAKVLLPAIKSGEVESKTFQVWDPSQKRVVRRTGYRENPKRKVEPAKPAARPRRR